MKTVEVKHKDSHLTIMIDDEDYDKVMSMRLRVSIHRRSQAFVFDSTDELNRVVLQKVLLGYPKERINFKDGNKLNLQKSNLELITEDTKRTNKNAWQRENRDKDKDRARYLKNKDKITECHTEWRKKNKSKIRSSRTRIKTRYQRGFYEVKRTGKREIDISFEDYQEIMKDMKCHYCTVDISSEIGFGLDRLDNSRGYFKDNVVPCCGACNRTKGDRFNYDEFKIMADALVKYRLENKT
jgi:hypothetical protein